MTKVMHAAVRAAKKACPCRFGPHTGVLRRSLAQALRKLHWIRHRDAFMEGALWALSTPQKCPLSEHEVVSSLSMFASQTSDVLQLNNDNSEKKR